MNWRGWVNAVFCRVGVAVDDESLPVATRGERAAERSLREQRYRIVGRNVRVGHDEADLVAIDPDGKTLVVVEVKARTDPDSLPEERVDHPKQYRLARLAANLQKRSAYRGFAFRFDVIAVTFPPGKPPLVRHIPAAFDSPF